MSLRGLYEQMEDYSKKYNINSNNKVNCNCDCENCLYNSCYDCDNYDICNNYNSYNNSSQDNENDECYNGFNFHDEQNDINLELLFAEQDNKVEDILFNIKEDVEKCKKCKFYYVNKIKHDCIKQKNKKTLEHIDCPICLDKFKNDKLILICGHAIHLNCSEYLFKSTYKCPSCMKTVIFMKNKFAKLDKEIAETPLPKEMSGEVNIKCNDCLKETVTNNHYMGLKCNICNSYNTYKL